MFFEACMFWGRGSKGGFEIACTFLATNVVFVFFTKKSAIFVETQVK